MTNFEKKNRIVKALNGSRFQLIEGIDIYYDYDDIKHIYFPCLPPCELPNDLDSINFNHMYIKNLSPCFIEIDLTITKYKTFDMIEDFLIKRRLTPVKSFDPETNIVCYKFTASKRKQINILKGLKEILNM